MDWPIPKNVKQLRGFLGLTGYYRRFIKSYSSIALPLTNLLKKEAFYWDDLATNAFNELKFAISTAPVLTLPDFRKPFVLETDASNSGVGAVLSQEGHPIAFFSKKLGPTAQKQSAYVREFRAITEALAKFRHYLLGHKFIIRTDQKSLKALLEQTLQTPEQQAWLHKFIGFDFTIEYKPGKENVAADALSRVCFMAWSEPHSQFLTELKQAVQQDSLLSSLLQQCRNKNCPDSNYTVQNDLLYWQHRLVIPTNSTLITKILEELHSSPIGGHSGITRTKARISAQFYWPHMHKDIKNFVQHCMVCQQAKTTTMLPAGLLSPLPIPTQVWEDIAMDFITGLPPSNGFTVIMVVVDRLTKYGHFFPLKSDYDSKKVAEVFMQNVVKLHGMPASIVSDRDKVFTSNFWKQLFKLQGTTLAMSSAYHPQSDGQSEALNKCLEMYLRCLTFDNPVQWSKALPWAEYWYNTSYQVSAAMTPFKALYGRDPPTLIRSKGSSEDPPDLQSQLLHREELLLQLQANLHKAQQAMKKQADKHRRHVEFSLGDQVLVKLQPYRQHFVALRKHQKLGLRYFGPFKVVAKIGDVAYRLALPPTAKIHPVFHVSQLKGFHGSNSTPYIPLPLTTSEIGPILQPISVLDTRIIIQGSTPVPQMLIQWEGLDPSAATWEDKAEIELIYPNFNLGDKVNFNGGSIARADDSASQTNFHSDPEVTNVRRSKRNRIPNTRLKGYI
jgi:hypothetical protein